MKQALGISRIFTTNDNNTFKVGLITDPTDASTFTEITNDANPSFDTSYQEFTFMIPTDATANYVAIMISRPTGSYNSSVSAFIDDIKIADPPTCLRPENLAFVSSTTTEATLSWTNGAEGQTAWQIVYSTDPNFDPDEVTPVDVTSNPGTIDGLTHSTTYYAYVRANCGDGDYSDWSKDYCQFVTVCDAVTDLPWRENFDAYTGSNSTAAPAGYPNDQLPICWQFLNRSENSSTYPQVFISSSRVAPPRCTPSFPNSVKTLPTCSLPSPTVTKERPTTTVRSSWAT